MARLINALEQILDSAGDPLVLGLLDFYETGGSTVRKTTYADSAETIANANPVVIGGDGVVPNIFGTGTYRVVVRTAAGAQLRQRDPVGGDASLSFGADWISTISYGLAEVVKEDGQYWESQTAANAGNQPSLDGGTNWLLFLADVATNTANIATNTADIATNAADIATNTASIAAIGSGYLFDARATLTSGTAVTSADVTAATTIYLTPYKGNKLSLYNGATWDVISFAEISIAVPATTVTGYDVFVYNNAGTATLELVAWTNLTTRATAIALQDGVKIKSGDATRRYVGAFQTTGVSGQTENSKANRFLSNYHHKVPLTMEALEATNSWTYSIATIRQANASTANQLNYFSGDDESPVIADIQVQVIAGVSNSYSTVSVGVDSTTVPSGIYTRASNGNGGLYTNVGLYRGTSIVGSHYLAWLESALASSTHTWYGDDGATTTTQSGITGEILG